MHLAVRRFLRALGGGPSVAALELENAVLRHQLGVLRRTVKRPALRRRDRMLLTAASRLLPRERWSVFLVSPQTLLRWHRELVARKWRYRHRLPGRPPLDPVLRDTRTETHAVACQISVCLQVAFWRKDDKRGRLGLRFNVSRRIGSDSDLVALFGVGLRFNVSGRSRF